MDREETLKFEWQFIPFPCSQYCPLKLSDVNRNIVLPLHDILLPEYSLLQDLFNDMFD